MLLRLSTTILSALSATDLKVSNPVVSARLRQGHDPRTVLANRLHVALSGFS